MTVPERSDRAVAQGRPLHLKWSADGTTEDWPGNIVATIEMPAITSEMPATISPQPVPGADVGTGAGDPATAADILQVDQNRWFTGPGGSPVPRNRDDVRMLTHEFTRQALARTVVSQRLPARLM
ncbi:hypothetical protein [Umezawaea sp. Da 62-37]|uniref:hypothetical protein n=1 Tax=Umezawaea sp. Da 62-37 TaxID=3075927 RepID=UPI0028F721A2|nr:hypothetical protein [Umezawaea sp. Da 62-37]WNV83038.1 hypothetical protein RM788_33265 [Umezawaea sp. Da 62-37]